MTRYVVQSTVRMLVDHADSPERVLAWFDDTTDMDLDVYPINYGRVDVVGTVSEDLDPIQLPPGSYDAWAALHVTPLAGRWLPEAWPARACPDRDPGSREPTPIRPGAADLSGQPPQLPASTTGKGGYHVISRLTGLLYDIKLEALAAKQSDSTRRRNNAFDEIAELAQAAADLVEKHARPAQPRVREVGYVAV